MSQPEPLWQLPEATRKQLQFVCSIEDMDLWRKVMQMSTGELLATGMYRVYVGDNMGFNLSMRTLIEVLPNTVKIPNFENIYTESTVRSVKRIMELREPLEVYLRMLGEK